MNKSTNREDELLMTAYVLQLLSGGYLDDFVNTTRECIEQHNWMSGEKHKVFYSGAAVFLESVPSPEKSNWFSISDYYQNDLTPQSAPLIPVGSVEYVESFLQRYYGKDRIIPINIPPQLMDMRFTRRMTAYVNSEREVEEAFSTWGAEHLFVKQANRCKAGPAGIYRPGERGYAAQGATYLVSESLNLETEWRVFVFHRKIRDVRCYSGDPWRLPDKQTVTSMVGCWSDAPPAYTLDVGVTSEGDTVIIEAHNFVSCGLYGFADATILPQMTSAGFKYEAGLIKKKT